MKQFSDVRDILLSIAMLVAMPSMAGAQPANCTRAGSDKIVDAICSSPELLRLDHKLALAFDKTLVAAKYDRKFLMETHRSWMRERGIRCGYATGSIPAKDTKLGQACLISEYKERLYYIGDRTESSTEPAGCENMLLLKAETEIDICLLKASNAR